MPTSGSDMKTQNHGVRVDMGSQAFVDYRNALKALMPINSHEKALAYREVWERTHGMKLPWSDNLNPSPAG